MSHYLKLVMAAIFGKAMYRNEVIWQRYGSHNDARRYGSLRAHFVRSLRSFALRMTRRKRITKQENRAAGQGH